MILYIYLTFDCKYHGLAHSNLAPKAAHVGLVEKWGPVFITPLIKFFGCHPWSSRASSDPWSSRSSTNPVSSIYLLNVQGPRDKSDSFAFVSKHSDYFKIRYYF